MKVTIEYPDDATWDEFFNALAGFMEDIGGVPESFIWNTDSEGNKFLEGLDRSKRLCDECKP